VDITAYAETITVSELNGRVKRLLQASEDLNGVHVSGEVSRLYDNGPNLYFNLKDETCVISVAMFRFERRFVDFKLEDGMKVVVRGDVSLYEPRGQYQLIAKGITLTDKEGEMARQFKRNLKTLTDEGLVDPERKRELPRFPERIGLVTGDGSAAQEDVFKQIRARYPLAKVIYAPSHVQGESAAREIREALGALLHRKPDVVLLTRGGGSVEDLWPFNDIDLARTVATYPVPIVSAVGHQIDTVLTDVVADVRAATPTEGATFITPDGPKLMDDIEGTRQYLDEWITRTIGHAQMRVDLARKGLRAHHPVRELERIRDTTLHLRKELRSTMERTMAVQVSRLNTVRATLERLSPKRTLDRGYAIVQDPKGSVITSSKGVEGDSDITVLLASGKLGATITRVEHEEDSP